MASAEHRPDDESHYPLEVVNRLERTKERTSKPDGTVYWWGTEEVQPAPPLIGPEHADVCIVGAGYTGWWTAYYLKQAEPALDIVIVDSSWAGSGASGHNDGFAGTQLNRSLHHLLQNHPAEKVAFLRTELCAALSRSVSSARRTASMRSTNTPLPGIEPGPSV
jgi:NADPH-dependent 2,4-dienoyl-CoA reductase/sulfur reductase-like enzyme